MNGSVQEQQPVTAGDLIKGTVVRVPATGRHRPYCLEIVSRGPVSQETGAVVLTGKVLAANGTTARKRPLFRTVVVMPARITIVRPADALRAAQLASLVAALRTTPGLTAFRLTLHVPVPQPDPGGPAPAGLLATSAPLLLVEDLLGELQSAGGVRQEPGAGAAPRWYLRTAPAVQAS
jgi:hypothetical protein